MIKHLIKIADDLDSLGLNKDADTIDSMIKTVASEVKPMKHVVGEGDTLTSLTELHSSFFGKTLADNIALNKEKDNSFNPDSLHPGQIIWLWCDGSCESN